MAKYIDENVAQAIANDIQKNRVLLGAFDTVDTSNANYNLITRKTGYLELNKYNWIFSNDNGVCIRFYCDVGVAIASTTTNNTNNFAEGGWTQGNNVATSSSTFNALDTRPNETQINILKTIFTGTTVNEFQQWCQGKTIQYELASSYTEKVIKGVPILNLDQNGANWLRSEWEKGLNLWSFGDMTAISQGGNYVSVFRDILLKKGTYTVKCNQTGSVSHLYVTRASDNATIFEGNPTSPLTFNLTEDTTCRFYWYASLGTPLTATSVYSNIMLNEGDHAYPYQPYNGAIVREKEIENVAYKNVNNQFSDNQTINGNTSDTPLILRSANSSSSFVMHYGLSTLLGGLGMKGNNKPYCYGNWTGSFEERELLTEDDIAELKSLVYDNQYPAVKSIKFNTFQALPNSIDGDSLIFGAGSDLKNIDGMSVVVNQLLTSQTTSFTFNSSHSSYSITLNNTFSSNYNCIGGHKYLFFANCKRTISSNNQIQFKLFSTSSSCSLNFANGEANGIKAVIFEPNSNDSSNAICLNNYEGKQVYDAGDSIELTDMGFIDLTQWFNGNIPSDLLSNPSLFTSKYWKGSLEYDTGHIESAKPKAIVSYGANIFDEIGAGYSIVGSIGQPLNRTSGNYFGNTNAIKVKPNTQYYFKRPSNTYVYIYEYDENNILIKGYTTLGYYDNTFVPDNATDHIYFLLDENYGTTYNHDICINISNSAINGNYYPYIAPKRYPISVGTGNSVNGVNTIKDIMGVLNTDRVIGNVDLGQRSWQKSGTEFYAKISGIKNYSQYLCSNGMTFSQDTNQYIYYQASGTSYETMDATQFKTAMSGVYLYFELNEPYTEQNPQDANFPINIEIQKGGSLEIESDLPCDITLEVAVSKVY